MTRFLEVEQRGPMINNQCNQEHLSWELLKQTTTAAVANKDRLASSITIIISFSTQFNKKRERIQTITVHHNFALVLSFPCFPMMLQTVETNSRQVQKRRMKIKLIGVPLAKSSQGDSAVTIGVLAGALRISYEP